MSDRHLITSEYPCQPGGVSDYTQMVASGLAAAGETVHVWCPPFAGATPQVPGVVVHRNLGAITPTDLRRVGRLLNQFPTPRRLLVQWVPHGYGYRSMNLPFCVWLWGRAALNGDEVEIMVHEPYLAFGGGSWKQPGAAVVHRVMTTILLRAARRVWVAIPAWERRWRPYAFGRRVPFRWLPVPSNIPVVEDEERVRAIRVRYRSGDGFLVGHFGTCGSHVAELLLASLPPLLRARVNDSVLLVGTGSDQLRDALVDQHRLLASRVHVTGFLPASSVSRYISACDVLIQPYPDGVSSRRSSVMAGLAHGVPIATTVGHLTEPFWRDGAVALSEVGDTGALVASVERLLQNPSERARIGAAARALHDERFDVRHTVGLLREATGGENGAARLAVSCGGGAAHT